METCSQSNSMLSQFVASCQQLGILIYSHLQDGRSICLSPFSIFSALLLALAGRIDDRFKYHLDLGDMDEEDIHANYQRLVQSLPASTLISNGVFVQNGCALADSFLKPISKVYSAEVVTIDFIRHPQSCVTLANQWVKKVTKGKINQIIDGFKPNTQLILLNAVYFKCDWKSPFDRQETMKDLFYETKNISRRISFMNQTNRFKFTTQANCDMLEMPYTDDATSMLICLPHQMEGLSTLVNQLTPQFFKDVWENLSTRRMKISIPRFQIERTYNLTDILHQLGLGTIGSVQEVSEIIQKSYIDVSEWGTTAAAVTSCNIVFECAQRLPLLFKANHPFFYVIVNTTSRNVLFMGSYNGVQ